MFNRDKDLSNYEQKIPKELLKKIKKIELRSRLLVNEAISGAYYSLFRGYGMEFEEVREYYPGDDYRRIDWNVTSRNNVPYVKVFREERQLNVMLLVDISGSLEFGSTQSNKRDKLVETASVLSFTALSNQDKIGAIFFSDEIEKYVAPSKNKNTILRLIREILFLKPEHKGTNINIAIDYAIENMKRRGVIFILSDFYSDIDTKRAFLAAKKHDIIPVIFSDSFEEIPVNVGLVDMIDNESGEQFLIDTNSRAYRQSILKRKQKKEKFLEQLKKNDIDPLIIDTNDEIEHNIVRFFKKRRKKLKL